jgi:hypothetical protein
MGVHLMLYSIMGIYIPQVGWALAKNCGGQAQVMVCVRTMYFKSGLPMRCYGISFSLLEMSFYVQKESQSKPSILQYMFDMDFILISFCQTLQKIGSSFQLQ